MPPVPSTPPITPSPAHLPIKTTRTLRARRWGSALLLLIVATFAVSAFVNNWSVRPHGAVTVIVRGADSVRTLNALDVTSGTLTPMVGVDPNSITTVSARTFKLSDGSTVTLDDAGIVRKPASGPKSVLVASPVSPFLRTPLSVWNDAARIAWMSPADGSIQVFYRSPRGAYLPAFLNKDFRPSSLGFTEDGAYLVAARIVNDTTDIYIVNLGTNHISKLTTINGLASVVPTP